MAIMTDILLKDALTDESKIQDCSEQVVKDIVNKNYQIMDLCERLEFALTSPNIELRVRGLTLVSRVLGQLPKDFLNTYQIEALSTFYAGRLMDHHNIIPAVIEGIYALVDMDKLPGKCIVAILQTLFLNTTCQSQQRNDRYRIFIILKKISSKYVEDLKSMSGDFIYGVLSSIDGERDPRNLNVIFSFMPEFLNTYSLLHLSEEMFEVFACYFPIDFNPLKNDMETITRANLAEKLSRCLVATPLFADCAINLAFEKLPSELVVAKGDSLDLLSKCATNFSSELLRPYFEQIWSALKTEIFSIHENNDIITMSLKVLHNIFKRCDTDSNSEANLNYQTIIFATILPHLNDVNQRYFQPSVLIGLACVSGNPDFASEKILNTFLININKSNPSLNEYEQAKIFNVIADVFKILTTKYEPGCPNRNADVYDELHRRTLDIFQSIEFLQIDNINKDLYKSALGVLINSANFINESNRALLYKYLLDIMQKDGWNIKETETLIERLGATYPIELQSNFTEILIRNFDTYSTFTKQKIFSNLLPLANNVAFKDCIIEFILNQSFGSKNRSAELFMSLHALNSLLENSDKYFVNDLQHNNEVIKKLVNMTQDSEQLNTSTLNQVASAVQLIMCTLPHSEQYVIMSHYMSRLNLKHTGDLYIAKGVLGSLDKEISLDDFYERLFTDLAQLSLQSENENLRTVAHELLCILANKFQCNEKENCLSKLIVDLKNAIQNCNAKAVEALSWITKGIIVRGSNEIYEMIGTFLDLLKHPNLANSAVYAFHTISAECSTLNLQGLQHLYKQKLFQVMLNAFSNNLGNLEECHLNAFANVLKTTPHLIQKINTEKIGPILFKCMKSSTVETALIALTSCSKFIEHQSSYFVQHFNHIIPECLKLSKFNASMHVRLSALDLLYNITSYHSYIILPYKTDVELELALVLDDPKRLVRIAAARSRNAWFLIGCVID